MYKIVSFVLLILLTVSFIVSADEYIIIGWNDLGMHCSNQDFSQVVILPPYNNIRAQVIRVGDSTRLPEIVTDNLYVTYEIPGNTYSIGKTNFWDFEDQLFGVNLPDNIGLTGAGLSGQMEPHSSYFSIEGVPLTPYTDADLQNEDPFQLGLLKLYNISDQLLATAQPVVPVSNEINCVSSGCHTSVQQILNLHSEETVFDPTNTPILCASCHSSNALGAPGVSGIPSLSEAVHKKHAEFTNNCYKCHPGPNTQCLRDVMKANYGFVCQNCHGSVLDVGQSIDEGREPWFEEPSCGNPQCHGPNYAEEPGKLFRESKGHGGLFCSACHGEPHAIYPSEEPRDNVQMIALQGHAGILSDCATCHGVTPSGAGPHGVTAGGCCVGSTGDIDLSGSVDISDLVMFVSYSFGPLQALPCEEEADVNGSGELDIADIVYLVTYMFNGGPEPVSCP